MSRETFVAGDKVWFSNFVGIKTAAVVVGPSSDSTGDMIIELHGSIQRGRRQARISQLSRRKS